VPSGRPISARWTSSRGCCNRRDPEVVIISVRLFTRPGCLAARLLRDHAAHRRAAKMHACDASASSTPTASAAMSAIEYGACTGRRTALAQRGPGEIGHAQVIEAVRQARVAVVDADDAKAARHEHLHQLVGQPMSCMPRPMISSNGSPLAGPWSSTSMPIAVGGNAHQAPPGRPKRPDPQGPRRGPLRAQGDHAAGVQGAMSGLEEPTPRAAQIEALPALRILRQPVSHRVERQRVHSHADVAGVDLDVLGVKGPRR